MEAEIMSEFANAELEAFQINSLLKHSIKMLIQTHIEHVTMKGWA